MLSSLFRSQDSTNDLLGSTLYDQNSFYKAFTRDLDQCVSEAIIESPFITGNRVASLLPIFSKMRSRGVKITINTRHPSEYDLSFGIQANDAMLRLQELGIQVLLTGGHHRKLAILDRRTLWEGSLNILSQNDSCEIMRRINSQQLTEQMLHFIKLDKFLR